MSELSSYGSTIERSLLPSIDHFLKQIPSGALRLGSINHGYHLAYSVPSLLRIFEYCEGDVVVTTAKNKELFHSEVFKVQWFIANN